MEKKEDISNHAVIGNIDTIDDDLLIEILSKLPPKPLFRFKCVSKAWCNLVSEAWCNLVSQRPNRERLLPSGIFYGLRQVEETEKGYKFYPLSNNQEAQDENKVDISLSFVPCYPDFTIVDSLNGLLLCVSDKIDERGVFYVCNPLTKRWVSLPKPPAIRSFHHTAKFFYDPNHPTYFKVLLLVLLLDSESIGEKTLLIFCSKSGKWVQSAVCSEPSLRLYAIAMCPVLFQQSLCFLIASSSNSCVIAIDINKNRAQRIKLPWEGYIQISSLHESEGSLYCIPHFMSSFQLWVLKDLSSKEWVLKFEIDRVALDEKIFKVGCPRNHYPRGVPYCLLGSDTCSLEFGLCGDYFIFKDHCKLLSYNFATEKVELIVDIRLRLWNNFSARLHLYTPGLMSLENSRPLLKNLTGAS